MGRIKQTYLKRVAVKLSREYPEEFSTDFQKNKENVGRYTDCSSKSMRNKIAGCLVRMNRQSQD